MAMAQTLSSGNIDKALKANKINSEALSAVTIPLTGPGKSAYMNADLLINPASTMKLVTTYAALELLGPAFQWKTEFYTDGTLKDGVLDGNLYLKGGGDPKLNMERLWLLLRDLRANGVRHVSGDLILDRNHFLPPPISVFDDDKNDQSKPFLVEPDSLLINFKSQRFIVRGEENSTHVVMEPPIGSIEIINNVKLKAAKNCDSPLINYVPKDNGHTLTLTINGHIAPGCSTQNYLAFLDHPRYAAGVVRSIWQEMGGTILGNDMLGQTPKDTRLLVRAYSADLTEIIRDINKYSNNTMAKQLFLSIGAHYRTPDDIDDAAAARRVINSLLSRKKISSDGFFIENGSGLSRQERITARQLGLMLEAAWKSPYAAEFISSLPIVAMDGTMRRRLRNSQLVGQAHIKTGTLKNVRAIAGFSRDVNGDAWAVVAIINHPQPWGASAILDQVLLDVFRQPKKNVAK
ncbi:MAG TPA: D-alanyl-D-alanine carboxypeptidase/D-alanyl-D-alanine-endopeptidase [Gammaproteobacteria bacterium]|nr:D-alanyl-D-alanine carboxypeptidase/D-alanyl-D-alanine-endopeptidase [Gammaproteobacteria bacterium]